MSKASEAGKRLNLNWLGIDFSDSSDFEWGEVGDDVGEGDR